jgi:hypothetical protein
MASRITKVLIVKDATGGDFFNGSYHDYIELEDKEGNHYMYAAIIKDITSGKLGPTAEKLEMGRGKQFTLSFIPTLDKSVPKRPDGKRNYWITNPRIIQKA